MHKNMRIHPSKDNPEEIFDSSLIAGVLNCLIEPNDNNKRMSMTKDNIEFY